MPDRRPEAGSGRGEPLFTGRHPGVRPRFCQYIVNIRDRGRRIPGNVRIACVLFVNQGLTGHGGQEGASAKELRFGSDEICDSPFPAEREGRAVLKSAERSFTLLKKVTLHRQS